MRMKNSVTAGIVAAIAALTVVFSPGTAMANVGEQKNLLSADACSNGAFKFTFRYNSGVSGAYRKLGYAHGNFAATDIFDGSDATDHPLRFCSGTGNGAGQGIKNNAASATNAHTSYGARVYYNSWFQGAYDGFQPGIPTPYSRNLANTYNNNASFQWT
ncbi:hypothetical protein ACFUN7_11560 [Streptomyces sp. NPDC057236]|uniref:hypothetical protein n=1 Tax=Streptomyces sp. NPDC057236 TaxID=3346059 RepID=UPI003625BEB1